LRLLQLQKRPPARRVHGWQFRLVAITELPLDELRDCPNCDAAAKLRERSIGSSTSSLRPTP
jgi:hypothetical protein